MSGIWPGAAATTVVRTESARTGANQTRLALLEAVEPGQEPSEPRADQPTVTRTKEALTAAIGSGLVR